MQFNNPSTLGRHKLMRLLKSHEMAGFYDSYYSSKSSLREPVLAVAHRLETVWRRAMKNRTIFGEETLGRKQNPLKHI
jgi:hypothetical protein